MGKGNKAGGKKAHAAPAPAPCPTAKHDAQRGSSCMVGTRIMSCPVAPHPRSPSP